MVPLDTVSTVYHPSIFMNNQEKLTILKISGLCILILASENHSKNTYFDQQSSLSLMYTLLFRHFDSLKRPSSLVQMKASFLRYLVFFHAWKATIFHLQIFLL